MLDAVSSNAVGCPLSSSALASLRAALSSSRTLLYETASYVLADALAFDPQAIDLLVDLSKSQKATERFNAILCLSEKTPQATSLDVITKSLGDRSSKVRIKAADWVLRLGLTPALPALKKALSTEQHSEARRTMEFSLALVRDGYLISPWSDKQVWFTLALSPGCTVSSAVDAALIEQSGAAAVAAQLRASHRGA
ncbi:HEAT repeat domain-containing protein [Ideonella sp. BN130291]|uniref:HEAT repeat domain-containing protein n=1 Tax=Ideonella sp. BN130291 TaxID=3112940 RepID=UPI003FA5EAF9